MRLATVKVGNCEEASVVTNKGIIYLRTINEKLNKNWNIGMFELIQSGQLEEMNDWYRLGGKEEIENLNEHIISKDKVIFCPLYREPRKIWGIGLNYVDHAADLEEKAPNTAPASFMKPDTTIIGHKDYIKIPLQSNKTTSEGELGIIIGKKCKGVHEKNWLDVVAGFTTIIDMTAEDILRVNPRYLTRAKSFDTFFSFGPVLVTPDEIEDVMKLKVATVINKKIHGQNYVSNMTFPPAYLVSFHSKVMTMLPGDIISTGTPRAVHINEGDVVECWIDGFEPLINPVMDLKSNHK
ncbi:fumarylacetoacetate hydrolase family protein [Anaeromicrobium sediminis]|uniref:Fumarylacetoacetate hydrolase n=1 Tax=Anaeromicrobium sediminis TaxID=1478221 RepID=A0A267MNE2_9FIRM|nr:fumarylacetoacetate hydrolase family protein [Anaeromicrobium sediminis]PAB61099.1 fumarylacetoacetate hydrolase [Anaeromicrobium sediminis]